MPAQVVLHVDQLDPFFLAIKTAVEKRGGTVVQSQTYDDENLHLTPDASVVGANVIGVPASQIPPFRALVHPSLRANFDDNTVAYAPAKAFFEKLREDYATGKRYATRDLPEGLLVICLGPDDFGPAHRDTVHQMIGDAVATKRPVVLVAEDPMDSGQLAPLVDYFPLADIYHDDLADLLHKTAVVVSRAGAGVILAHIYRTPAVLYEPVSFDHLCPVVTAEFPFPLAVTEALATTGVYAKYLYWYFHTQAFRADDPAFANRLCEAFEAAGFDAAALGFEVTSGLSQTIVATHEAASTLTKFLEFKQDVSGIRLIKALKVSEKAWVFAGRIKREPVVIKRFFEENAHHTVRSLKGELDYMSNALGDGPFRVNRCLHAWPEAGTVVLSYAPGQRIYDEICKSEGKTRDKLMHAGGGWLNAYAAPRHRITKFGPRFWLTQLEARPRHLLTPEGNALFDTARAKLSRLAQITAGSPVTQAASHGDYSGINVMYDKGIVTGVDIQGECWLALAKDAALFVVWQSQYDPRSSGSRIYGIDGADYDAFFTAMPLLADEHLTTVPFFIGLQAMHRFLDSMAQGKVHIKAARLLAAYVSDIDALLELSGGA